MSQLIWVVRDLVGVEQALGFIPEFIEPEDARPVAEQFNERYAHGGGWQPMPRRGWRIEGANLVYDCGPHEPDEVYQPLAFTVHPITKEMIVIYDFSYVMICQPEGGDWELARCD